MPVSKSKRGQQRKANLAKAAGGFGGGGVPGQFDRPPQAAPATTQPDEGSHEQTAEHTHGTGEKK